MPLTNFKRKNVTQQRTKYMKVFNEKIILGTHNVNEENDDFNLFSVSSSCTPQQNIPTSDISIGHLIKLPSVFQTKKQISVDLEDVEINSQNSQRLMPQNKEVEPRITKQK